MVQEKLKLKENMSGTLAWYESQPHNVVSNVTKMQLTQYFVYREAYCHNYRDEHWLMK